MFSQLVKQMAEREGVTEKLKADNQMEWIGRMNNIRENVINIINQVTLPRFTAQLCNLIP